MRSHCRAAAMEALQAFPGGLHVGGGVTPENAGAYLDAGASHVIVTSYVFRGGRLEQDRLNALVSSQRLNKLMHQIHVVLPWHCHLLRLPRQPPPAGPPKFAGESENMHETNSQVRACLHRPQIVMKAHQALPQESVTGHRSRSGSWSMRSALAMWQFVAAQVRVVGRKRLVLDLSCRKRDDKYYVVRTSALVTASTSASYMHISRHAAAYAAATEAAAAATAEATAAGPAARNDPTRAGHTPHCMAAMAPRCLHQEHFCTSQLPPPSSNRR